jgi:hypothetical protein
VRRVIPWGSAAAMGFVGLGRAPVYVSVRA